jgi:DNA-binding NtrC family response regulator
VGNGSPVPSPIPSPIMAGGVRLLEEVERQAIIEALDHYSGHRQRTATALGIGVRTLGLKLKKWKELQLVSPTL